MNGNVGHDLKPRAGNTRAIEFALCRSYFLRRIINIQDNTGNEFIQGENAYNVMKPDEEKTLYWFDREMNFMARAETFMLLSCPWPKDIWRFVIQNFDPLACNTRLNEYLTQMNDFFFRT